jgi:Flp pilus assembly protein TadB
VNGWLVGFTAVLSGLAAGLLMPSGLRPQGDRRRLVELSGRSSGHPHPDGGPAGLDPSEGADAAIRVRAPAAAAAGGGVALFVGGWLGAALGMLTTLVVWRTIGRMEPVSARRRREHLTRSLPHAVDLLASSLAVGASPTTAVEQVATAIDPPLREELTLVASRLALGADPIRVWSEVGRHPQLGALGRSLVRAIDSGASVSSAMHRLAEDLRRTARTDVESRARAVGVKAAAPLGLCLLPAFILIGIVPLVAGSVTALLLGR